MAINNLDPQKLQFDYQQTLDQFKTLADIRFKLLAFVPTLAGAAIAFLSKVPDQKTALAVGILGFIVTIGITFYDIRNTQFYDAAVHRAKWLEALLELPVTAQGKNVGGLFNERPGQKLKFFWLFEVWHDRGLSLVYGGALGGWAYIIANASLALAGNTNDAFAFVIAVAVGLLCAWEYQRLSGKDKPKPTEALETMLKKHDG